MNEASIKKQLALINWAAEVYKAAQDWPRHGEDWPSSTMEEEAELVFKASGVRPNELGEVGVKELRQAGLDDMANYEEARIDKMRRDIFGDKIVDSWKK